MGGRIVLLAAVLAAASTSAADQPKRPKPPKPGTELQLADLGWPATTRSARVTTVAEVVRAFDHGERYGKLAVDTRVAWKRIVAGRRCPAWLELEPRGFVCARDLAPSDEPAAVAERVDPAAIVDRVLAQHFLNVDRDGAAVYDTLGAARRGDSEKRLEPWTFLGARIKALTVTPNAVFLKTGSGYIAAADLVARPPSEFVGIDLTPTTPWPFAWVVPHTADARVAVRAAPKATAPAVRDLARRERVPVLEKQGGFARIGPDAWVALAELRIAGPSKRPAGVRADERWLDVDLDQNTLVAYEGDTPVYATLVSTGFGSTPPSLHRIRKKNALRTLNAPSIALGQWSFPDVPFVLEFRKHYALHTAYWHDSFGKKRGHGCVNLSPRDARRLFDWTLPHVPAGWAQGDARDDEGTPVRIRDRKHPDPKWTKWDSPPPVPTLETAQR